MRIVVIGSGLAGVTFAEAAAARHDVTLITAETLGYYSRPRLSHGMALSDEAAAKIVLKPFSALAGVRLQAGRRVETIDELKYDVLVLATGSAARIPPPLLTSAPHILTLNSLDDLLTLRRRHAKSRSEGRTPHWAVIGGGLIGCELASDLHKAGDRVTIFHRESRLIELQLDEAQSQALHEHFAARSIEVRYGQDVRGLDRHMVFTAQGEAGPYDGIIVSTGFAPRIELARDAGLATARGIVVDERLRTAVPSIYALGDVAEVGGRLYPFVSPIRSQALWLAKHLEGQGEPAWTPPAFTPIIKIHDLKLQAAASTILTSRSAALPSARSASL
jgi:NAD(P)H-nitrite reductase large subunit